MAELFIEQQQHVDKKSMETGEVLIKATLPPLHENKDGDMINDCYFWLGAFKCIPVKGMNGLYVYLAEWYLFNRFFSLYAAVLIFFLRQDCCLFHSLDAKILHCNSLLQQPTPYLYFICFLWVLSSLVEYTTNSISDIWDIYSAVRLTVTDKSHYP